MKYKSCGCMGLGRKKEREGDIGVSNWKKGCLIFVFTVLSEKHTTPLERNSYDYTM